MTASTVSGSPGRSHLRLSGRLLVAPALIMLLVTSILPFIVTVRFSLIDYRLLGPKEHVFIGLTNYTRLLTDPAFLPALGNSLLLIAQVLAISIGLGLGIALLLERVVVGRGLLRILVVSPFFVMPPVAALLWKNLLMAPVSGFFAWIASLFGLQAFDWFARAPLSSIALIVAWQWLPFACLILLTSLQSFDREQREAAELDGASPFAIFRYLVLPYLARPIAIVVMMETIFLLSVFAEIFVTTGGGRASSNLAFLVYSQVMFQYDIGAASAAGLVAVLFANILAYFLVRAVGRSLDA
ncbi:sugar ABC transporter permease [Sphingobium amiense]|uniref:Sugar ABC transporter permease n=1 Tax=Sphingobium amiense TaxID=135719 RepID=A0A494W980_9SPHN|nr:sugar ABC transporter permease [Sphingobium amiense]BBD97210.1 sugar ABC transporter permease [Sphingobium amiense]